MCQQGATTSGSLASSCRANGTTTSSSRKGAGAAVADLIGHFTEPLPFPSRHRQGSTGPSMRRSDVTDRAASPTSEHLATPALVLLALFPPVPPIPSRLFGPIQ